MGAKAVQHRGCTGWLLQSFDQGPSGRPHWITDLERCEKQLLCPGCGADLRALYDAGQLIELGARTLNVNDDAAAVAVENLDEKLQLLGQLRPLLAPQLGSVLLGISADLERFAHA